MKTAPFKKGQKVKFKIPRAAGGFSRGAGKVTRLVPKGAITGAARLTVIDKDGETWRPFPSQVTAA